MLWLIIVCKLKEDEECIVIIISVLFEFLSCIFLCIWPLFMLRFSTKVSQARARARGFVQESFYLNIVMITMNWIPSTQLEAAGGFVYHFYRLLSLCCLVVCFERASTELFAENTLEAEQLSIRNTSALCSFLLWARELSICSNWLLGLCFISDACERMYRHIDGEGKIMGWEKWMVERVALMFCVVSLYRYD